MAGLKDAAERKAFSVAIDAVLKSLNKDPDKALLNIVELTKKFMGDNFRADAYEGAKKMIQNPDAKWMKYVKRLLTETDPHVAKMTALNLGNILNAGFDQIFNLYNPIVYETADIIDTYVYRIGMVERQYSIGAAVGLLKSVISFILILSANKCAKKATGSGIF